jgi:hypothetical protein
MCISILLAVFGLFALIKGEFSLTRTRKVQGSIGRGLGVFMLIGAALPFILDDYGSVAALVVLIITCLVGIFTAVDK